MLLEQVHGVHDSGIVALAAAGIVCLRGALDGQHKGNVAQAHHFFAEGLVDQGGVGVDGKLHIIVLFGQLQDVLLAHQRLAAGQHVQVHAQLLALSDDLVHILKAEVVLVAVLTGPAAHAVHVAGRGGVKQDQPGNVALVLHAVLADGLGAPEESLIAQVQGHGAGNIGVGLVQHTVDQLGPLAVRVAQGLFGALVSLIAEGASVKLLCQIHDLTHGLFRILICMRKHHVHHLANGGALHLMGQILKRSVHKSFSSKQILLKSSFILWMYGTTFRRKVP